MSSLTHDERDGRTAHTSACSPRWENLHDEDGQLRVNGHAIPLQTTDYEGLPTWSNVCSTDALFAPIPLDERRRSCEFCGKDLPPGTNEARRFWSPRCQQKSRRGRIAAQLGPADATSRNPAHS